MNWTIKEVWYDHNDDVEDVVFWCFKTEAEADAKFKEATNGLRSMAKADRHDEWEVLSKADDTWYFEIAIRRDVGGGDCCWQTLITVEKDYKA